MFRSSGVQKLRFPHGLLSAKKAIKDHKERPTEGGRIALVCAKLCQTRTSSPWPGWSMEGKMEMYLFDVVRRTNQNSILFDLFLHLVPGRALRLCPHATQPLLSATGDTPCSAMVSQCVAFTQTMTLTSTLSYLTLCPPPVFKKRKTSQVLHTWEAQGSLLGCFQTFLPSQGLSCAFLCNLQSVSFPRAHHTQLFFG